MLRTLARANCPTTPLLPFWLGGFEGADHLNASGQPLDMARSTGHIALLDEDYARAASLGLDAVRESIGWRLSETAPGVVDLSRAHAMAAAARRHGLRIIWTLMHYGTPPDVNLFDDALIDRFAQFAGAVARGLADLHDAPPVYNLINEIGFVAWSVSESNRFHPYVRDQGAHEASSKTSGYLVKRRLVRAVLAAIEAVRAVDPRARFLHIEPVVHVVPPEGRDDLGDLAGRVADYQWQAWDLIAGRDDPGIGGHPDALDLIGINHYHSGQWEVSTEARLHWHLRDHRRQRFATQLQQVWARYRRPLLVAETSHVGQGRVAWLNEVASEVRIALRAGVPVSGICLYPLVDRHDWDDPGHWHHSGLWDADPSTPAGADAPALTRQPRPDYAAALREWQRHLPVQPVIQPSHDLSSPLGKRMPTLIVFSHLRWNFVWQRPQHLMWRLAQDHHVIYVEEPVRGDGPARFDRQPQSPTLDVLVPHTPIDAAGFHDLQLSVLRPLLEAYLHAEGIDQYLVWFYTPMALPLLAALQPRAVVYDCMDELSAFNEAPRQLRQRETALMKIAGLVLTGGPALYDARKDSHANIHCLPSAVDAAHYAPREDIHSAADAMQHGIATPRLGFFGVIDERFDATLIATLAARRPDWQFVMVGPVVKIDPATLPQAPNVHWLGMQRYDDLPALMAAWDVCLMPFALNASTRFISPTKTLEYMAGGKPVVSTPVPDVMRLYGDQVHIAATAEDFESAIARLLAATPGQRESRAIALRAVAQRHSWDAAAATVRELIGIEWQKAPTIPAMLHALAGLEHGEPAAAPMAAARAPKPVRTVVIGAGPTGLSAAYHLQKDGGRPEDVLLIEREDQVGGWCRSIEQDGFTWDCAGHIMFSNDADVLALYETLLGDNLHWQNREAWIYSKDVYTRYPFQGSLYGLPPAVLKECIVGAIEARFGSIDGTSQVAPSGPPSNFAQFIERVWGRGIGKHFATPYNEKLWALPLEEMETSWLGGRVPLPDLQQMIEGALEPTPSPMGPNARFGYPLRGGFQALMDGFLPLLRAEMAMKTSVLQVSPSQRTLRLDDGRTIRFESLISTMSLPRLIEACGDEAPADVRASANALRHVSVRCVNLGIELAPGQDRLTDKHWIYYPEDSIFHRIFVQGNASPHCNAPGGFALTCEITYAPGKPLPCDGAALIARTIEDCRRVGIIDREARVISSNQVDMPTAYVVYDHDRAAHVARIRQWVGSFGIVLAGRYAEWEYYNSDHAFLAGRRAAREVAERFRPDPLARRADAA